MLHGEAPCAVRLRGAIWSGPHVPGTSAGPGGAFRRAELQGEEGGWAPTWASLEGQAENPGLSARRRGALKLGFGAGGSEEEEVLCGDPSGEPGGCEGGSK